MRSIHDESRLRISASGPAYAGIVHQVAGFIRIIEQIVERFLVDSALSQAVAHQILLARPVVDIGHRSRWPLIESPDVLPALRTHGPFRFVAGVIAHLPEDFLVYLIRRTGYQGDNRSPLEPWRRLDIQQLAQGRVDVDVGNHAVHDFAAV